jgi:hypothetical protein
MILPVVYDLARNPPTYDSVTFAMRAERERLARGADELAIEILPGPRGGFRQDRLWPQSIEKRHALLNAIVLPTFALLGSCQRVTVHRDRSASLSKEFGARSHMISFRHFVESYAAGLRPLRPRHEIPPNDELITITLREAEHWPNRNSRVDQWRRAAAELEIMGYRVIVVRDTEKADEPFYGIKTAPEASRNVEARAALYTSAALNLFVNNGPAWMAMALNVPVIIFKVTTEGGQRIESVAGRAAQGISPGCQMRGAPAHQRIVWADDNADMIVNEAANLMERARG